MASIANNPIIMAETTEHLLNTTRQRMADLFTPNQVLGRLQTIGCVAVEITQRCNLDCTLCYLSEHSQQVRDIPIAEVFKRLDGVIEHFGAGTHVQITGGDPTLRKHTELIEIVRYASDIGLHPALFTNGIAASAELLAKLAGVGLKDVAFHVDTTQRRESHGSEMSLNVVRQEYIERARGLGLMVIFNTTVHEGNFAELPMLVKFFSKNADVIGLVSFQLQAETGRGEWGSRDDVITQQTVRQKIEDGANKSLPWDVVQVGHGDCHSYLPTVVTNHALHPIAYDEAFFADFLRDFQSISWDRHAPRKKLVAEFLAVLIRRPRWWLKLLQYLAVLLVRMSGDLLKSKGKVHKLTFFVQNFMDAEHLVPERIDACSFMVMTADGPVSMCKHNAARDDYILKPLDVADANGQVTRFEPLKWKTNPARRSATKSDIDNRTGATV
ncbi:MAG: radical SAM protein [Pseudomonadota bacterium]